MAGEPQPSDNIYVVGLPAQTDEELLRSIFSPYGTITQCKVLSSKAQFQGNAAALVRFSSVEEANYAIESANGCVVEGFSEPLVVRFADPPKYGKAASAGTSDRWSPYPTSWSGSGGSAAADAPPPSDNLYVTGLPPGMTEEMLQEVFQEYGQVVQCRVMGTNTGQKCAALVRFVSAETASAVKNTLHGNVPLGLMEPIQVRFADPPGTKGQKQTGGPSGAAAPAALPPLPAAVVPAGGAAGHGVVMTPRSNGGLAGLGIVVAPRKGGANGALAGDAAVVAAPAPESPPSWGELQSPTGSGVAAAAAPALVSMDEIVLGFENTGALPGGTGYQNDANTLYIAGLPPDTKDAHLYRLFAPFGAIAVRGVRAVAKPDGSCKGIGFVNFLDTQSAQTAITAYNGAQLPDGTLLKVAIKR